MFEEASRIKLRFETDRGNVSTEDLWDLPLTCDNGVSLDELAKAANRAIRESEEESFVVKQTNKNAVLALKLDIIKRIIDVRLEMVAAQEMEVERKAKKQRIIEVIADKQDDNLKRKSVANLTKMLDEL